MKTIPPPLPNPSSSNHTPSRFLGLSGLIPLQKNPHKPLGVAQCNPSTLFSLLKSSGAFAITFIIQGSWLWEQIFIVSSIRLIRNGRNPPSVLMVGNGMRTIKRENLIRVGCIRCWQWLESNLIMEIDNFQQDRVWAIGPNPSLLFPNLISHPPFAS